MVTEKRALAEQHVTRGREIVARQRELIEQIRARKGDATKALSLLETFERSLAIFEQDLAAISAAEAD